MILLQKIGFINITIIANTLFLTNYLYLLQIVDNLLFSELHYYILRGSNFENE